MSKIMRRSVGPLAVLFVLVVGLVTYGKFVIHPITPETIRPVLIANQTGQDETDGLEIELITLRPAGFEPVEISRPKGAFLLLIEDRSGKENSSFQLQRVRGERLKDMNTNRRKAKWYDTLDLPPGEYVLTNVANAGMRCRITILP